MLGLYTLAILATISVIPILLAVFLIKGIKYLNTKERRNKHQVYQQEKTILDEIENELNSRND